MTAALIDGIADNDPIALPPRAAPGNGYIYVIEFSNDIIKIGQAVDLGDRLGDHVSDASAFDLTAERVWCSDERRFYDMAERMLIAETAKIATGRRRKEYFTGVTFEQVRDLADTIVRRETSRRMERAWRLLDEGQRSAAVEAMQDIGFDLETSMALINLYRGGNYSESGVAV